MKHTQGKWEVVNGANTFYIIYKGDQTIYLAKTISDSKQDKANAKLIASAPDLLEACKLFLAPKNKWTKEEVTAEALDLMKQAIAKAEGDK